MRVTILGRSRRISLGVGRVEDTMSGARSRIVRTLLEASQNEALLKERNTIPRMGKYRRLLNYLYTIVHVDTVRHT